MPSDFEYAGIENHTAPFQERSAGTGCSAPINDGSSVELPDGDQVVITSGGRRAIWSLREQRVMGYHYYTLLLFAATIFIHQDWS